jgi:pyruvate formate lyase activating enzyme
MKSGGHIISSLEFPERMSLVIFTAGCILRCPYCHNPGLIDGGEDISLDEIYTKIRESTDFIDAVVITGGEAISQYDDIKKILKYCHELDLKIKLDTNGYYPKRLKKIIKFLDYVALDVKAPFDKYKEIIGVDIGDLVKESMEVCSDDLNVFLECRTTYVPFLMNPDDIRRIAQEISCDIYTLQQFRNRVVLDERLKDTPNPTRKELIEIADKIKPILGKFKIKTAEFGDEIIE